MAHDWAKVEAHWKNLAVPADNVEGPGEADLQVRPKSHLQHCGKLIQCFRDGYFPGGRSESRNQ